MAPHRKRQKLSEDGAAALEENVVPVAEQPADGTADATKQDGKKQQRRTLFIRALPPTTTTDELTDHFSQSYPIKHATAVVEPSTKQCKGYGFVTFADAEDAQKALGEFNGSTFQGRKVKVELADPRHRDIVPGTGRQVKSIPSAATAEAKAARMREQKHIHRTPKLIVRNLPWCIKGPEQLGDLFRSYGKIKHAVLPKKGGLMAGFGIVVLRGRRNAEKALEGVNGKEIDGRTLAVDWAVDKETWQKLQDGSDRNESVVDQAEPLQERDSTKPDIANGEADVAQHDLDFDGKTGSQSFSISHDYSDSTIDGSEGDVSTADDSPQAYQAKDDSTTVFVRNLPFTCSDETLHEHFSQFGSVRYARIVIDQNTERPRGTGFVCFYTSSDAEACLRKAPRVKVTPSSSMPKKDVVTQSTRSILQNEDADSTGQFTMEGRVLDVSRAVSKSEAARLTEEGVLYRGARDRDKRRLYLLSEGTIPSNSSLYRKLAPSEITMREASAKQRKALVESNPSLHLSLTRLAIRNIPRSITTKDLKALAREAIVGFAKDVKAGIRQPLSKEELRRGGEDTKQAERERKAKGKGVVKQAKIVYEGREGVKVTEKSGAGRSRGYGFIEYYTHRSALMGLRWLNGHSISYNAKENKGGKASHEELQDRKKRLVVEFAIENAQVVSRRNEKEAKAQVKPKSNSDDRKSNGIQSTSPQQAKNRVDNDRLTSQKRKREVGKDDTTSAAQQGIRSLSLDVTDPDKGDKLAKRQRIIARKRVLRRSRKFKASI